MYQSTDRHICHIYRCVW